MPTAFALDHLVLVVADTERTLAWYARFAGLAGVRVDEGTIIDVVPGLDDPAVRGHLDHICLVVDRADLDALAADPDLEVVDSGPRFGARGEAESIYVRDPDDLLVEFRTYDD